MGSREPDLNEGLAIAVAVALLVQLLADLFQRIPISKQQIPGSAPHLGLFRIDLHPALVPGVFELLFWAKLVQSDFLIEVAVGCAPGPSTAEQLRGHASSCTAGRDCNFTLCHSKQNIEVETVIGVA